MTKVAPDNNSTEKEETTPANESDGATSEFIPLESQTQVEKAYQLLQAEEVNGNNRDPSFVKRSNSDGQISPRNLKGRSNRRSSLHISTTAPPNMLSIEESPKRDNSINNNSPWKTKESSLGPNTVLLTGTARIASRARDRRKKSINVLRKMAPEDGKNHRYVMSPTGVFRSYWDPFLAISVIYLCWMIPVTAAISWWEIPSALLNLNHFLDYCFILDMFLSFRTGFISYGEVIMDPSKIARHYASSWFIIDVIASFPAEFFFATSSHHKSIEILKYMKLPKLLRIGQLFRNFKKYQRYQGLMTVLFALLFCIHLSSTLWIAMLQPCTASNNSEYYCQQENFADAYFLSVYYSTMTMVGISADHVLSSENLLCGGYHYPQGIPASLTIVATFMTGLGVMLVGVLFGTAVFVVKTWNRAGYKFRKRMDCINYEMDYLGLPPSMRHRIKAYYDYLWYNQRGLTEKLTLLQDAGMSEPLRKQIAIFTYKDLLVKIPLFKHANDHMLGMVCLLLQTLVYMPMDTVITKGEFGRELFIVSKGKVMVQPLKPSEDGITLHEGSFFGEIALLMEVERTRSVIATTMCELCVLDKAGFDAILGEFPSFAHEMKRLVIHRAHQMTDEDLRHNIAAVADRKISERKRLWKRAKFRVDPIIALRRGSHRVAAARKEGQRHSPIRDKIRRLSSVIQQQQSSNSSIDLSSMSENADENVLPKQQNRSTFDSYRLEELEQTLFPKEGGRMPVIVDERLESIDGRLDRME